ncbi:hypothetical protein H2509_12925 [Stappia sp. F7233]|uniref:Uncharacterized protein n=1 Tax=Stappia albiluteola TaxID=2758565 RepID=A0A839AG66_9HYPH|nr:hypothetical protein [Stappia albiluteola]
MARDDRAADDRVISLPDGLARIRHDIRRPDLSDDLLLTLIGDAIADLALDFSAEEFACEKAGPELRSQIYAALCLPSPVSPLVMPEQALERSRLTMLERLRLTFRRLAS